MYFLCDIFHQERGVWESDYIFPVNSVFVSKTGYYVGGNYTLSAQRTTLGKFKICNTNTLKVEQVDYKTLHKLWKKEELVGVEDCWDCKSVQIRCISVLGYLVTNLLELESYNTTVFGDEYLTEKYKLDKVRVILIPNSSYIPLFYPVEYYSDITCGIYRPDVDVYIGDYIVYLIQFLSVDIRKFLCEFNNDSLKLWGISTANASYIRQRGYINYRVTNINEFNKLIAKIRLLGGK